MNNSTDLLQDYFTSVIAAHIQCLRHEEFLQTYETMEFVQSKSILKLNNRKIIRIAVDLLDNFTLNKQGFSHTIYDMLRRIKIDDNHFYKVSGKSWSPSHCPGYKTFFGIGGISDTTKVLEIIAEKDPEGSKNIYTYYPALAWVKDYEQKYNLYGGFENGWYLPSIGELNTIATNKVEIINAFKKLGLRSIINGTWLSRSEVGYGGYDKIYAMQISQTENKEIEYEKGYGGDVLCLRAF